MSLQRRWNDFVGSSLCAEPHAANRLAAASTSRVDDRRRCLVSPTDPLRIYLYFDVLLVAVVERLEHNVGDVVSPMTRGDDKRK